MSLRPRKRDVQENVSTVVVPSEQWSGFLDDFSRQHRGWSACLETYDLDTRENVLSHEAPLESIDLDLEEQRNPRINVIVHLDNKVVKHILYRPSSLVLQSADGRVESLRIETVNTETTVHFRKPRSGAPELRH
jgi:Family of unknown function (DUF5335)